MGMLDGKTALGKLSAIPDLHVTPEVWVVDGLGPYNQTLALARLNEYADWLAQYREVARTDFSILYHLK